MSEEHVVCIDLSPSTGFVSRVYRDGGTPTVVKVKFHELDPEKDFNLKSFSQFHALNAKSIARELLSDGQPSLIVMSKLITLDLKSDPSGPRRAGQWWEVVNTLVKLYESVDVPIAEVTPMTGQYILTGRSSLGRKGFDDSADAVRRCFPDIENIAGFRYHNVAQAIAGAVALGWSSPATVDYKKLRSLRNTVGNSFPSSVEIPKTVEQWEALNNKHKSVYRASKKEMVTT